jgi:DNA-binding transcriptional ArsR family regulator
MFLEKFLISKVRIKILKLFFFDLEASYHVREVVRRVDEEINAVRRELKNMQAAGLLESKKDGNKVVYTINEKYPLYQDFISLVHKEFGLGGYFYLHLAEIGDVKYAIITRSFTKGLKIEPQNVDFMVVGKVNMQPLALAVKEAERDLGREIHYTVMTEEEFEYRKNKRDAFLLNIIAGSMVMLVGDQDSMLSTE